MPLFDLPLSELVSYRPEIPAPADLETFWHTTLEQSRQQATPTVFEPVASLLSAVDVYDVTFSGWGAHPIKAWLLIPVHITGPCACVVEFIGYSGGRGLPHQWLTWPGAGHASFVMDTRGQGWARDVVGDTGDPVGSGPANPGLLTKGIESAATYYYRRLYTDAVLAVEAARSHPGIDPARIAVAGTSQGGGIAIAAAALASGVRAAAINVPFMCGIRRSSELTTEAPYVELIEYLRARPDRVEDTFSVLGYFDGAVLSRLATAPALFSVGLMDEICPPSGVYAAYNWWQGPKEIVNYPYNQHEGGSAAHVVRQLEFFATHLS